jgi:hypothetical protein
MKGLLEMDPAKRLTAEQAIMEPYFDDVREPEYQHRRVTSPKHTKASDIDRRSVLAKKTSAISDNQAPVNVTNKKMSGTYYDNNPNGF